MRLTLRTLLAYLDEILDPHDAEQLQRKIQDSEFATALVHQIRGSIRRMRLDAPTLDAQGIGGDVNSVAEYLDNTLPPDQVPALEKVCLETEMHLGEVASCHQILTLVLGGAAEVSDGMRQRAYAIAPTAPPTVPESSPTIAPATARPTPEVDDAVPAADDPIAAVETTTRASTPVSASGESKLTTKEAWRAESEAGLPEGAEPTTSPPLPSRPTAVPVGRPEYLEPKSSWLRSAMVTVVIAVLILFGLMFASGSWTPPRLLARWFGGEPTHPGQGETQPVTPVFQSSQSTQPEAVEPPPIATHQEVANPADDAVVSNRFSDDATTRLPDAVTPSEPASDSLTEQTITGPPDGAVEPEGAVTVDSLATTDEAPLAVVPPTDLPLVPETDSSVAVKQEILHEDSGPIWDEVPESLVVGPTRPEKDTTPATPDVPPAPDTTELATSRRSQNQAVPAVTSSVPLVDPNIDLEPAAVNPPVASPAVGEAVVAEGGHADLLPTEQDTTVPEVVPAAGPIKLKSDQLLLTYDGRQGDWSSADSSVSLDEGHYIMCLPAFQADISIGNSMRCSFFGATRVQLGPASEMTVHDGRMLLKNRVANRSQAIRFQNDRLEIKMAEEDSLAAIEAMHERVPGTDLAELPHAVLRIYAIKNAAVVDFLGESYQLSEGQYLLAVDNYAPRVELAAKSPSWISVRSLTNDRKTAGQWQQPLIEAENLRSWLLSQTTRRYADASLAARCLAELDEFGPIVAAFHDPEQRSYWDQEFETLRRALTRGSETVAKLQFELEKVYGSQAPFVMEMIRGYSEGQLASGAATELVRHLDHPRLDFRVFAFQNLKTITGSHQNFKPQKPIGMRRTAVDAWKKRLRQGHVRYRQAPRIVALLESFVE